MHPVEVLIPGPDSTNLIRAAEEWSHEVVEEVIEEALELDVVAAVDPV